MNQVFFIQIKKFKAGTKKLTVISFVIIMTRFFCIEWKKFWKDIILFSLFCWRIALKVDQNVKSIFDHMFCIKEEKLSRDGIHQAHSKVIAKNYDSNFVMMLRSCLRDWIDRLGMCWGLSSFSLFVSSVSSLVAPIYRL